MRVADIRRAACLVTTEVHTALAELATHGLITSINGGMRYRLRDRPERAPSGMRA